MATAPSQTYIMSRNGVQSALTVLCLGVLVFLSVYVSMYSTVSIIASTAEQEQLEEGAVQRHLQQAGTLPNVLPPKQKELPRYDSSDATVMSMAHGYDLKIHKRFVGSLRKSGFKGNIILATEQELKPGVEEYLNKMNATHIKVTFTECDKPIFEEHEITSKREEEGNMCIYPYPDVKVRWGRYPFLRDALKNCAQCTGPVLFTDARDVFFQRDPFGDGAKQVHALELYAEKHLSSAKDDFVGRKVKWCKKGYTMDGPMLCSGTTIGTREIMLEYFDIMYQEMKLWMTNSACLRIKSHGGDQAIMNYLFYSGQLERLNPQIYHPRSGTVNTVGVIGNRVSKAHYREQKDLGIKKPDKVPFRGFTETNWAGEHLDLTDSNGYFIEVDGSPSRIIHQWDRFGPNLEHWLDAGVIYDNE